MCKENIELTNKTQKQTYDSFIGVHHLSVEKKCLPCTQQFVIAQ
jgi:hypothetical protein